MEFIIIFLIILAITMGLNIAGSLMARRYVDNLNKLQLEDPNGCLKKLDKWPAKLLLPGFNRMLIKADIYAALNDEANLMRAFDQLRAYAQKKHSLLTTRDKAMVYQKQLSYALYKHDAPTAHQLNDQLKQLKESKNVDDLTSRLIEESNVCVNIYIDHNYAYIDKAKQAIDDTKNKIIQGIWHYRLAYLYFTKHDQANVEAHLDQSIELLNDSELLPVVQQVKSNPQMLETVAL